MNGFDRTMELVGTSTDSAGSAQKQFALYSLSLEASTNRLTTNGKNFMLQLLLGNGIARLFVNTLTGLMEIINKIGPLTAVFGLLL